MPSVPLMFGEWRPDMALLDNQLASIAENVYPGANSYLPFAGLASVTATPLPATCVGLTFATKSDGSYVIYAGTAANLYRWDGSAWVNVSVSLDAYNVTSGNKWVFAQFGTHLVAVHNNNDPQTIDVDSGTNFAALLGSPPRASHVAVVSDFLVLSGLVSNPRIIRWSGINDIEEWTIGNSLCDEQEFPDCGPVRGVAGGETGLVVQDRGIRTMQFLPGDPVAFTFSRIEKEKGCMAKYGWTFTRGTLFFQAEDGFYALGLQNPAIGASAVNDWFRNNCDPSRIDQTVAFADADNPRVCWAFHSSSSSLTYDRLICFDWLLLKWTYATIAAQMWAVPGLPVSGVSLDADTGDVDDSILDSAAPSLDSYYGGGRPVVGAIGATGLLGFLTGSNLTARVETAEMHVGPGMRCFISEAYPLIDAQDLTLQIGDRERLQDQVIWGAAQSLEVTGKVAIFASSRLYRFRATIPAGNTWTHAQGVQVLVQPDGEMA